MSQFASQKGPFLYWKCVVVLDKPLLGMERVSPQTGYRRFMNQSLLKTKVEVAAKNTSQNRTYEIIREKNMRGILNPGQISSSLYALELRRSPFPHRVTFTPVFSLKMAVAATVRFRPTRRRPTPTVVPTPTITRWRTRRSIWSWIRRRSRGKAAASDCPKTNTSPRTSIDSGGPCPWGDGKKTPPWRKAPSHINGRRMKSKLKKETAASKSNI